MRKQIVRNIEEEFLDTSFKYLAEHGLENTSIRDLCKGIGISSGSLYYWFDGKEDVYINAAKYGLTKDVECIFSGAYLAMDDVDNLFSKVLKEAEKYKKELRLIYQIATSPVYGERMRKEADNLAGTYETYIRTLAEKLNVSMEDMAPVVFMFISIMLDFVIWDDHFVSKMQIDFLQKQFNELRKKGRQ